MLRQDAVIAAMALATGAGGLVFANQYLQQRANEKSAEIESRYATVAVVVAATDIARGDALHAGSLASRSMPRAYLPQDAVRVEQAAGLLGASASIEIRRGTPVLASAVRRDGGHATLSGSLSANERAITIAVDEISSHAGGLRAGDRVDLFHSRSVSGEAVLVPLLQHVQILGTGHDLPGPVVSTNPEVRESGYATVTLRVSAADAPRLLLAQQAGQVAVLLRARGDDAQLQSRILRAPELMQTSPAATPRRASGMELLIGGGGASTPDRSWLRVGESLRGETT